jgi:hypothetical protein
MKNIYYRLNAASCLAKIPISGPGRPFGPEKNLDSPIFYVYIAIEPQEV